MKDFENRRRKDYERYEKQVYLLEFQCMVCNTGT
jgi:hypothetical protein